MEYDVYLITMRGGRTYAHVPALVGCNWNGATPEAVAARAGQELAAHLAWLQRHGLAAPPVGEPAVPRLVYLRSAGRTGGHVGFFDEDRAPVTEADVVRTIGLMEAARADLLALTQPLGDALLDREPGPGAWSIRQILRHVAGAEHWYLTRIPASAGVPRLSRSKTVWERLQRTRALALAHLRGLDEGQRSALAVIDGELWSARKVLRRFVEHEREHHAHVGEVLGGLGATAPEA